MSLANLVKVIEAERDRIMIAKANNEVINKMPMYWSEFEQSWHFSPMWEQRIYKIPVDGVWTNVNFAEIVTLQGGETAVEIPIYYGADFVGMNTYLTDSIEEAVDHLLRTPEWIIKEMHEDEIFEALDKKRRADMDAMFRRNFPEYEDEEWNNLVSWNVVRD